MPSTEKDDYLSTKLKIVSDESRVMAEYWVKNISSEPLVVLDRYPKEKKGIFGREGRVVVESGLLENWYYFEMGDNGMAYLKRLTEDPVDSWHEPGVDEVAYGRRVGPGESIGDTIELELPIREIGNRVTQRKKQKHNGYRSVNVDAVQLWLGWLSENEAKRLLGYEEPEKCGQDGIYPFFSPQRTFQRISKSNWVRVDWEGLRYE